MKKVTKHLLLKGEGANQHMLYGNLKVERNPQDFSKLYVSSDGLLRHEDPSGNFAEHNTLQIENGEWIMGKQVEYNPFSREITQSWHNVNFL